MSLAGGTLTFLVSTAAVLITAIVVATRLYPARPWTRIFAVALCAIVEIVVVSEILGAIGWLAPMPLMLAVLVILAAVLFAFAGTVRPTLTGLRWPLPIWLTLVLVAFALGTLAVNLGRPTTGLDTLQYHYPLIAEWMQSGNLTEPARLGIGMYAWFYPSTVELVQHWSVTFFGRDFLVSIVGWIFIGLAMASIAGVARRLGATIVNSALAGLAFATIPIVLGTQVRSGQVDMAVVAFCALAVFFGLGWWQDRRLPDAAFCGLAIGLAAGSKLIAVPYAGFLGVVFCAVLIIAWRSRRTSAGRAWGAFGLVLGGAVVSGSFFFLRNLAVVGNPLFPTPLPGFTEPWLPMDFDVVNFTVADYVLAANPHPWIVGPWVLGVWLAGILAICALVAVPVIAWRVRRNGRDVGPLVVGGWIVPLGLAALYAVTPTSAGGPENYPLTFAPNIRYAMPFIAFALLGLAAAIDLKSTRACTWIFGAVVVANFVRLGLGLVGAPGAGPLPLETLLAGLAFGIAATAIGYFVAVAAKRSVDRGSDNGSRSRAVRAAGAVVLAVAIVSGAAAAYYYTTDNRYGFGTKDQNVAFTAVRAAEREAGRPLKIAHATFPPIYPLYGPEYANTLVLTAEPTGVNGVSKPFTRPEQLVEFVNSEHPDYLVVWDVSFAEWLAEQGIAGAEEFIEVLDTFEPNDADFALEHPEIFELVERRGDVYVFAVSPQV